jgi:hypothetical protein
LTGQDPIDSRYRFSIICKHSGMQRQLLALLMVQGFAFLPGPATAEPVSGEVPAPETSASHSGLYVTGAVGANWPVARTGTGDAGSFTEFSDPGFSTEIGFGYNFKPLRAELTYALDASKLQSYNTDSGQSYAYDRGGETVKNSAFASLYWDLFPNKRFTPYVGAGLGFSSLSVAKFSEPGYDYSGYTTLLFGYQAKAGLSYGIDPESKVFAEVVYRGTNGFNTNDGFDDWRNSSFSSWGGQIGVRVGL